MGIAGGIGERWQRRISSLREYAVVQDGNIFRTSLESSYLYRSEHLAALELQQRLLAAHEGVPLERLFAGETVETPCGEAFCIRCTLPRVLIPGSREGAEARLLSELTLIRGIGPATERRLKGRGFRSIQDLLHHPRFRKEAAWFLQHLREGDGCSLEAWARRRSPKSHLRVLETSFLMDPEEFAFLDIETMGLFSRPIILFGLARVERERLHVLQYLVRDPAEEPAALWSLLRELEGGCGAFVTYNGRSFDIPYIRDRAAYYGLPWRWSCPHFDLLHFSRRRWRETLQDLRLVTLERQLLGKERVNDVPSQMIPEFYETYLRTGNPGPLMPIVEHNRQDVCSLVGLFARLAEDAACR